MRRLLAILAHPDDEGMIAGTLARHAAAGDAVHLACATRGEVGEISDPLLATPETLGAVREEELARACAALGLPGPLLLDYRDSGMAGTAENADPRSLAQADPEEAIGRLVAIIRRLRPEVVITFEPFGWYGHPDHIAVHRLATAAYRAASDPDAHPAAGAPWRPSRLLYAVLPLSRFARIFAPAGGAAASDTGAASASGATTTDAAAPTTDAAEAAGRGPFGGDFPLAQQLATEASATHAIDVRDFFDQRQAVTRAHRTQFAPDSPLRRVPPEVLRAAFAEELFVQVVPPLSRADGDARATELFGADR